MQGISTPICPYSCVRIAYFQKSPVIVAPLLVFFFGFFAHTELRALNRPEPSQLESLALCSYFYVFPALHAPTNGYARQKPPISFHRWLNRRYLERVGGDGDLKPQCFYFVCQTPL